VAESGLRGFARREAPLPALVADTRRAPAAASRAGAGGPLFRVDAPGASFRRGRRLWVAANALAARGLGPEPLALLHHDRHATLFLARPADAVTLREHPEPLRAQAELTVLLDRVLCLGALSGQLDPGLVAFAGDPFARRRALLLAPQGVRLGACSGRDRARRARQLASELLAVGREFASR
jgi:hypothetical protein